MEKTTLSVIKADVGGFVGHSSIHEELIEEAEEGEIDTFLTEWARLSEEMDRLAQALGRAEKSADEV